MTENSSKSLALGGMLGVLSVFLLSQNLFIVNPALSGLANAFPDVSFATILLLSTIVSLLCVPFSLISGAVAGTKVKYKTLTMISILFILVGGIAPYFFMNSFSMVLAARVLVGIGSGLAMPLGNVLIMRFFSGQKSANMQGIGTAIMNISGIVYQTIAGIVCVINVKYTWLVYSVMLIPLLLVLFFMPEPEAPVIIKEDKPKEKVKLPASVYIISAAYGILFMFFYPMLLNMSSILTTEKIGTAALAGTILSMYSVGGMIAGAIFGKLFKVFKKMTIPIGLLFILLGLFGCYFTKSPAVLMVCSALTGIALFTIWPACMVDFGQILNPAQASFAAGLFLACLNCGGFLASPYAGLVSSITGNATPRFLVLVGAIGSAVIAVIWTAYKLKKTS